MVSLYGCESTAWLAAKALFAGYLLAFGTLQMQSDLATDVPIAPQCGEWRATVGVGRRVLCGLNGDMHCAYAAAITPLRMVT